MDIDTSVPVSSSIFTRFFAVVLGLIHTFLTKVRSSLGDRTRLLLSGIMSAWSHGVYTCVLLFVQMNVVPSGVREIAPKDEPDLWRFTIVFLRSFDFHMMSSEEV